MKVSFAKVMCRYRFVLPPELQGVNWLEEQTKLEEMASVEQLIHWASFWEHNLPPLRTNVCNVMLDTDQWDYHALKQVPEDVLCRNPQPLCTTGDGACFLFTIARLLWGVPANSDKPSLHAQLKVKKQLMPL